MKARNIHRIAHWVIMTLLLTFPILMVGISTFGKESQTIDVTETYEYETNEVNSVDDLVQGNIYKIEISKSYLDSYNQTMYDSTYTRIYIDDYLKYDVQEYNVYKSMLYIGQLNINVNLFINQTNDASITSFPKSKVNDKVVFYFTYLSIYDSNLLQYTSASDYLGEKTVDYVIHNEDYKQDVNNWINGFLNLPINAWYQSLMNVIGVGFTNSTVMNVIYVMPVYIIWVFIFDLVVDCFLVLIRLPHKLLNRLSGGENE